LDGEGLLDLYSWRSRFPMEFERTGVEHKIRRITADSRTFKPSMSVDLVLIDGDHRLVGVRPDTINAFRMLRTGGAILWHDYGNPGCPENTAFLNGLAESVDLVQLEDTMLVMYFQNPEILAKMKALE